MCDWLELIGCVQSGSERHLQRWFVSQGNRCHLSASAICCVTSHASDVKWPKFASASGKGDSTCRTKTKRSSAARKMAIWKFKVREFSSVAKPLRWRTRAERMDQLAIMAPPWEAISVCECLCVRGRYLKFKFSPPKQHWEKVVEKERCLVRRKTTRDKKAGGIN